jgi:hypothetical protein
MWNSNELFNRNVPLFDQLNSSKKRFLIDKNLSYNHKRTCELFRNNNKGHSYAKMIIEVFIRKKNDDFHIYPVLQSYDALNKSQAIEFLQQASSTESKLSLLDAMKE